MNLSFRFKRNCVLPLSHCAAILGGVVLCIVGANVARAATDDVSIAALRQPTAGAASTVYPFLGVDWGGEVFLGAAVPFGVVKLGPDVESFDGQPVGSGYASTGLVDGFSHLHLSGGSGKYGNILIAPVTGRLDPGDIKSARSGEDASVGYYRTRLTRYDTLAELTATRRVGFHRYTFPSNPDSHITVDVAHLLSRGNTAESQQFLGGKVTVLSDHEVTGVGRYRGGWNEGGEYRVYFYLIADTAAQHTQTWAGPTVSSSKSSSTDSDTPLGASLDYATTAGQVVQLKVGISFISEDQARRNVKTEAPGWSFDTVRNAAVDAWNQSLSHIRISGATDSQRRQFFTAMYHTMLVPSDRTGENPLWKSSEPYYDDYYAIWDTFRTESPLLTLIAPDRERDIIRSLIDIYRHEGYMPDARSGNTSGRTQGGSNADVMVADAYVKGITGIDYESAFKAMQKDAEVPPPDPHMEGRGGLLDYNSKGYVTTADERSGSRTVEYAYDDFAIAELACGLGHDDAARRYAVRAGNWANLWDSSLSNDGVSGFIRPRNPDGSWAPADLTVRGTWPNFEYEGDIWTYSLYAPQDVRRLMEMSGGKKNFIRRLDTLFYHRHFDMSNEPGFLLPMLYLWAGRPDRVADLITLGLEREFLDSRGGLPEGNDDSGAMSSWLIFQSLGIYPNAGQDVYLIGTPSFPEAEIDMPSGKVFRILARNLDREHANRYVQSATLDGKPLDTAWFRHSQIANGGTLELTMGPVPSDWGTRLPPPSLSDPVSPLCAAATASH
ncbi:GH92 family glycosyl hydrolase [Burkholderia sp. R-69927]|nr:GH92 family glycosyl hydrolase [Burkholderia sp. R-69927]